MGRRMVWMYETEVQDSDSRGKAVTRTLLSEAPPQDGASGKTRRVRVAVHEYKYGRS
jgi:hypothetical protein